LTPRETTATTSALTNDPQLEGWNASGSAGGGPPPWHLYRLEFSTVFGEAGREPHGATRWSFAR
jgi:hypothetical protein